MLLARVLFAAGHLERPDSHTHIHSGLVPAHPRRRCRQCPNPHARARATPQTLRATYANGQRDAVRSQRAQCAEGACLPSGASGRENRWHGVWRYRFGCARNAGTELVLERMLAALMDACGSKSASISRLLSGSDDMECRGPGEDGLRGEAGRTTRGPATEGARRLAMPRGDSARSGLLTPSPRANRPCMPARSPIKGDPSGEDGLRAEDVHRSSGPHLQGQENCVWFREKKARGTCDTGPRPCRARAGAHYSRARRPAPEAAPAWAH